MESKTIDYHRLMDADTLEFIDVIDGFYPPEAIGWPIGKNRAVYDVMSRQFHAGRPTTVSTEDCLAHAEGISVPVRLYRREDPDDAAVLLYLHGGGFVLGGLDSHDDICADLCDGTGYTAVSVDYRLAPEHTGTAAYDDARAALSWTVTHFGKPVVLVGESAGGSLAASLAQTTRGEPFAPAAQVLVYPSLGGSMVKPSVARHANAPLLSAADLAFYGNVRGAAGARDPRYEALADTDFSGLPPTVVFTAECDPLASDGPFYAERIRAAGGRAHSFEAGRLPHGYLRGRRTVAKAGEGFTETIRTVAALGRGDWPF